MKQRTLQVGMIVSLLVLTILASISNGATWWDGSDSEWDATHGWPPTYHWSDNLPDQDKKMSGAAAIISALI